MLGIIYDLDLWPHSWPWPWMFQGQFQNSCISGIVGLIDVKWKVSELIGYWAHYMTFDHTRDLDLGVSRSESEIALPQEWDGRLTWNEKDVSHPFMTMILTSVNTVGWADVPDSDRGDFRHRRAIDISSSPSGEHPEQSILAHKSEQPTAGCISMFDKYCCYIKLGGIITNLALWNPWGYVTDMSKYHNAGMWSMDQNISCFMLKNIWHLRRSVLVPCWPVRDKPLGVSAFLRLDYWQHWVMIELMLFQCCPHGNPWMYSLYQDWILF